MRTLWLKLGAVRNVVNAALLLVAVAMAGSVSAAIVAAKPTEAAFYGDVGAFQLIGIGRRSPARPAWRPQDLFAGAEHHWTASPVRPVEFRQSTVDAPRVTDTSRANPPSDPDRVTILFAGLVGVGGLPLVWGWKRRRRGMQPADGALHGGLTRILVLGTGPKALEVQSAFAKSKCPIEIVGFYPSQQEEERGVAPRVILPTDRSLTETAQALHVDEIVVAVAQRRGGVLPMRELLDCRLRGVRVRDLAGHFEHWFGQIRLDSLKPGWMIFGEGFRQSSVRMAIKEAFDVICSGILLAAALPVMAVAAIAILVESGFPLIYRQERVGLNGKTFNVIKFRSMRKDAEKDGRPRWAQVGDSRITRVGRIIRKLRIDELPQLFSVFAGHMSLVGPRPERAYFVDQLTQEIPFYNVRHSLKPGVTGWAQVRYHYGASVEDAAEKLQYDLYYVKNHSLLLDLKILFGTVSVVLLAKGA